MYTRLAIPKRPSIRVEKEFAARCGGLLVAGVDEAGRGPLAGPVVAAAVILPFDGRRPVGLRDSKQLSEKARERLFPRIQRMALSYGVGIASPREIDLLNILEATRLAARRAIEALSPPAEALVTDALELPEVALPTLALVKGDSISASVSAASILAKVTRDRLMRGYAEEFPEYGWDQNRGYPTADHYAAIEKHGPTILHRLTFNGVAFFDSSPARSRTYRALRAELEAPPCRTFVEVCRGRLAERAAMMPPEDVQELADLIDRLTEGESACVSTP